MPNTIDVAIIGGGAIGCSIAYQLAKRGVRSTVLERSHFAAGASGATLGVIAPLWHVEPSAEASFNLGIRSLEMFPHLARELLDAGIDPEFRQSGILKLAFTHEQSEVLKDGLAWQGELGYGVRWLDRAEVIDREPAVAGGVLGGVYSPQEGYIRGQRYVESLVQAASQRGASFVGNAEVIGLMTEGQKVVGVQTNTDTYYANHTVLAAGPWTGLTNRWLWAPIPVRPVKGQRILLRKTGFLPKSAVRDFNAYIVPQVDGNILIGATREEGRFDQEITADGVAEMLAAAAAIFPDLKDATFVEARAGVRPGSPDGVPILGPVPGWEGFSVASGHDQVGIMLSPASGELMADYISTGDPAPLEPFSLARFRA